MKRNQGVYLIASTSGINPSELPVELPTKLSLVSHRAPAPPELELMLMLALWTGQRQGDLLRLPWSAYSGTAIKLRQSKTKRTVVIPVSTYLKEYLERAPRRNTLILTNTKGLPWTSDGFRTSWAKLCTKAKIDGLTFHDLRGSAVVRLALERKFNELAAPIEAKHDAPWLRRQKGMNGVDEVRVVDLDRGVERPATPEEIERGIEYCDYEHFIEGKAA